MKKILASLTFVLAAVWLASIAPATILAQEAASPSCQLPAFHAQADFDPQSAVWVAWPSSDFGAEYISSKLTAAQGVIVNLTQALAEHVTVKMVVSDNATQKQVQKKLVSQGVNMADVKFITLTHTDPWTRDWGPIFVVDGQGNKKVVNFKWNAWGLPEYADPNETQTQDDFAPAAAAEEGLGLINANIVSEGGNHVFNGKGTMMAVLSTDLQRNPGYNQSQIEDEFRRVLGVKNFVWLQRGVVDDNIPTERSWPGPGGQPDAYAMGAEHIDEFARFAGPNTILLAEVTAQEAAQDPIAAENRIRLENNYQILKAARDQDGKKFTIIRVPAAETMYYQLDQNDGLYQWVSSMTFDDGSSVPAWPAPVYDIAATSYMNFVVTNGAVLVQQYWKSGLPSVIRQKDSQALQIIGSAFPGRQVIGISAYDLDINSGGIHCATQEEPATN